MKDLPEDQAKTLYVTLRFNYFGLEKCDFRNTAHAPLVTEKVELDQEELAQVVQVAMEALAHTEDTKRSSSLAEIIQFLLTLNFVIQAKRNE